MYNSFYNLQMPQNSTFKIWTPVFLCKFFTATFWSWWLLSSWPMNDSGGTLSPAFTCINMSLCTAHRAYRGHELRHKFSTIFIYFLLYFSWLLLIKTLLAETGLIVTIKFYFLNIILKIAMVSQIYNTFCISNVSR